MNNKRFKLLDVLWCALEFSGVFVNVILRTLSFVGAKYGLYKFFY